MTPRFSGDDGAVNFVALIIVMMLLFYFIARLAGC
jgi:hypothetical protein